MLLGKFPNISAPLDKTPVSIYKKMKHILSPVISELFILTIKEGNFPTCLKVGQVIPILKCGKKYQLKKYRPITTVPALAKVFKKLMHTRMMDFINKFKFLNSNQFGFILVHNISYALLEFLDNAYEAMNKHKVLLAIFLDLPKAFHTVDHEIQLRKLEFYCFRGKSLQWLSSFLSDRTQFIELGNKRSCLCKINIGVPQGSTQGPLLFLIYTNDFHKSPSNLNAKPFADDTTLYKEIEPSFDTVNLISEELTQVQLRINRNRLSLNVEKTSFMILSNRAIKETVSLTLNRNNISRATSHKFLGVTIDETFKLVIHIN